MATDINLAAAVVNAMADALDTQIGAAATAATIEFRTGTQPADPDEAATGAEVATVTMTNSVPFGDATAGVITAATITDDTSATGNAAAVTWFRIKDGDGNAKLDGTVGLTSGFDINFAAVIWPAGSTVQVTSLVFTMPDGT